MHIAAMTFVGAVRADALSAGVVDPEGIRGMKKGCVHIEWLEGASAALFKGPAHHKMPAQRRLRRVIGE